MKFVFVARTKNDLGVLDLKQGNDSEFRKRAINRLLTFSYQESPSGG
jgi:hypothetical protein